MIWQGSEKFSLLTIATLYCHASLHINCTGQVSNHLFFWITNSRAMHFLWILLSILHPCIVAERVPFPYLCSCLGIKVHLVPTYTKRTGQNTVWPVQKEGYDNSRYPPLHPDSWNTIYPMDFTPFVVTIVIHFRFVISQNFFLIFDQVKRKMHKQLQHQTRLIKYTMKCILRFVWYRRC